MGVCSSLSRPVVIGLKPDGVYRVVEMSFAEGPVNIPLEKCSAAKKLFKGIPYATCNQLIDQESNKKRVFIWLEPMT